MLYSPTHVILTNTSVILTSTYAILTNTNVILTNTYVILTSGILTNTCYTHQHIYYTHTSGILTNTSIFFFLIVGTTYLYYDIPKMYGTCPIIINKKIHRMFTFVVMKRKFKQ